MVTLDGSVIESSGAMTGGSASRTNRNAFGGGSVSSSLDRLEAAVEEANLVYSTVEAALREVRTNQQNLRDRIHGLDDSDHSLRLRNWKADLERAQKSVQEARKKVVDATKEFEGCDSTQAELRTNADEARESYEQAVSKRSAAAQDLQDHAPDHLSQKPVSYTHLTLPTKRIV